ISNHTRTLSQAANPWLSALNSDVCHLGLLGTQGDRASAPPAESLPDCLSRPFALSIGRMSRDEGYKGHEELIRAWPSLEQARPGLELVLIGDGNDRPRLEGLARQLRARVCFLGAVSDSVRDACLQTCRCFCMPARGEGFGLVYLEAMRAGKPVLAG